MSSSEKGQQASLLQSPSSHQPQSATATTTSSSGHANRRTSILLGVLAAVTVVAVLAVSAAVLYASNSNNTEQSSGVKTESGAQVHQRSLRPQASQPHVMAGIGSMRAKRAIPARVVPSSRPVPTNIDGSCQSQKTESNIPAAHIKGHRIQGQRGKWIEGTDEVVPGYQQRWLCNDVYVNDRHQMQEQAFVDGGVWFNQTDKSIYVPMCGYYMIYSQILFMMDHTLTESVTVYHNLKIEHNCSWESDTGPIQLQAKASIAPYDDHRNGGVSTTYTADVVHLCAGGRVWIEIPDGPNGVPCCPRGEESGTFMGLILIANTPCSSWPPVITMTTEY